MIAVVLAVAIGYLCFGILIGVALGAPRQRRERGVIRYDIMPRDRLIGYMGRSVIVKE